MAGGACAVELGGRTGIWSSEVTVGGIRTGPPEFPPSAYGYHSSTDIGALSDVDFDLGASTGVVIFTLMVYTTGTLELDESSALLAADYPALRLHVCGDTFDLAAASAQQKHIGRAAASTGRPWGRWR